VRGKNISFIVCNSHIQHTKKERKKEREKEREREKETCLASRMIMNLNR